MAKLVLWTLAIGGLLALVNMEKVAVNLSGG